MTKKSIKLNKNVKRKAVSNPLFKLTKKELDCIKNPILISVDRMKKGTFNPTDWYNVMFYLTVGNFVIDNLFTEDTIEAFKTTPQACSEIEERSKLTEYKYWEILPGEMDEIEAGVDAVNELHDTCLRVDVLKGHRFARDQLIKKYSKRKLLQQ